ncbi:hypothetical protein M8818_004592 [Zalaria obscura]|uniref:Uncharacterized protein n=1 Tax=Zalaria obscura TaxID=2024903 RepID=A0ACC3SC89_9PEZI
MTALKAILQAFLPWALTISALGERSVRVVGHMIYRWLFDGIWALYIQGFGSCGARETIPVRPTIRRLCYRSRRHDEHQTGGAARRKVKTRDFGASSDQASRGEEGRTGYGRNHAVSEKDQIRQRCT